MVMAGRHHQEVRERQREEPKKRGKQGVRNWDAAAGEGVSLPLLLWWNGAWQEKTEKDYWLAQHKHRTAWRTWQSQSTIWPVLELCMRLTCCHNFLLAAGDHKGYLWTVLKSAVLSDKLQWIYWLFKFAHRNRDIGVNSLKFFYTQY